MTPSSIENPCHQMIGSASIPATGTTQRRFVQPPHSARATAAIARYWNGMSTGYGVSGRNPIASRIVAIQSNQYCGAIANETAQMTAVEPTAIANER